MFLLQLGAFIIQHLQRNHVSIKCIQFTTEARNIAQAFANNFESVLTQLVRSSWQQTEAPTSAAEVSEEFQTAQESNHLRELRLASSNGHS
jgi:hypothetical protein